MNRIILIGNGFDLAHGLKTSYKDFIDDLWHNEKISIILNSDRRHGQCHYEDELIKIDSSYDIVRLTKNVKTDGYAWIKSLPKLYAEADVKILYKNNFLRDITQKNSLQNWVDIEEEYYAQLIKCTKNSSNDEAKKLNQNFECIKTKLTAYLKNKVKDVFAQESIARKTYVPFDKKDFFMAIDDNSYPEQILFLSFNYTGTAYEYLRGQSTFADTNASKIPCDIIHIHGDITDVKNPIIFGYGDEIGQEYATIENLNDNEYLENMKAIKYLETDNYKRLSNFINSNAYQVFIYGHSCGKSDRTLLNELFEHDNCVSIKAFYYQYVENGEAKDNYSDMVKNMSRHFSSKAAMRKKVVNKIDSYPLVAD